ncbi:MAG: hypothetical protein J0I12_16850 [Candidatus Eremiobacteraeota bacterium]|nr:hypothetical protein [Candidatus Eremiobacteraeota bacterium]
MIRRFLWALLVLAVPALGSSRLEALFEHLAAESGKELLEARYPLVHLVLIPRLNGFYFEPGSQPAALEYAAYLLERGMPSENYGLRSPYVRQVFAIKNLVPLLDRPPVSGCGTVVREYPTGKVPAKAWASYLRVRYPDLVVFVHQDNQGFCAVGQESQLDSTSELVAAVAAEP